ncbi:phosphate acyltransferase [Vagococcus fluvialis]|uniref:Phosphate butyryltransferase n=1 Tax=Vagococcus fluvialis TaxID=2738 RepID=A0A7X6DA19_9ENTE|nr:phosphate acyltransferase [Vagococcus fluvialis]NKC68557.1 phosphate butyryltransferase [Vagococcus fluvialis]
MKNIAEIKDLVKESKLVTVAIAGVSEEEIELAKFGIEQGFAKFVLVGDKEFIENQLEKNNLLNEEISIFHVDNSHDAPQKVMDLINEGVADVPMKGQVHTSTFLKAVLDKKNGFFANGRLSQITMFDGFNNELQFLTDCAINIDYSLMVKKDLIENAVSVAKKFAIKVPKVALLGAVETVSEKMPDTIESAALTQMNRRGQITDCVVDGPLSLDNAISKKFAKIKKIDSPVAGSANILVANSLNEANTFSKALIHYDQRPACSIIAGTLKPIIMTSRTDRLENKLNTIMTACFLLKQQ